MASATNSLQMKRVKEAIEIFKLNVEMFPRGFNTYDSLGEAYIENWRRAACDSKFKKSLELNPKKAGAAEKLKKLEAAP